MGLFSLSPIDRQRCSFYYFSLNFHSFKWSILSHSPTVTPFSSFCRSVSAIQLIPTFIFTKWYCYHCRNSSCFHSMSLFTHSTGPHFTVFTVALPLVGLPLVNFSHQVDPFNSSQVSPICPHHPHSPPLNMPPSFQSTYRLLSV